MLEKLLTALQSISNLKSILLEFGIILTAIATEHTLSLAKRKRKYAVLFLVKCIGFYITYPEIGDSSFRCAL